jgi:murein DD-endopeptidase MepM/ murein hydrolase activator NlpD
MLVVLLAGCSIPRWPAGGTMTSPFGLRFIGWRPDIHPGVDISMPIGTPVKAMKDGTVEFAGTQSGYGTVVIMRHGAWRTIYAHLSELRTKRGDKVEGGAVIALSGASGNASGPHLHFEIVRAGKPYDPVLLLGNSPPAR